MRKELPIAIGLVLGLLIIAGSYFTGSKQLATIKTNLDDWFTVVQAWTVAIGVVNLTQIHLRKVSNKREGWPFSIWLIVCMYGMILWGIFVAKSANDPNWKWMYNQIIAPMNATVYSSLVFYIGSAAYRSFRVRNAEATVLLVAAVIMMLGRVPLGPVLLGGQWIAKTADWILNVPNAAGMRGIQIGACLGGIATALRILLGIERGHLGGTGE